jgi:hypothetical protein
MTQLTPRPKRELAGHGIYSEIRRRNAEGQYDITDLTEVEVIEEGLKSGGMDAHRFVDRPAVDGAAPTAYPLAHGDYSLIRPSS